jgi:hypothetical protein
VIVTDLGGVASRKRGLRLYIALTRALDLLRVVGEEAAIRHDPVSAALLSP